MAVTETVSRPYPLRMSRPLRPAPGGGKHDPLPALLLLLTVFTGVVDAVSIIALGRVFVANMTGNVVFVGFALTGVPGFSLVASLAGLAGFLAGARAGGRLIRRLEGDRGRLFATGVTVELVLVALPLVATLASSTAAIRDVAVGLLAIATGLQNAVVRKLAVPDLTTTVLTMTLTGIAADGRSGWRAKIRRVLAVFAMLLGAALGGLLVPDAGLDAALGLAAGLLAAVAVAAQWPAHRPGIRVRSIQARS